MKIKISEPDGPYSCELDPGVMEVELREVFLGVGFVTESGQRLSVSMRDGGFELMLRGGTKFTINGTPVTIEEN